MNRDIDKESIQGNGVRRTSKRTVKDDEGKRKGIRTPNKGKMKKGKKNGLIGNKSSVHSDGRNTVISNIIIVENRTSDIEGNEKVKYLFKYILPPLIPPIILYLLPLIK